MDAYFLCFGGLMKKLTAYFSKGELVLWGGSAGIILMGTSKNYPFGICADLLTQQFVSESPQYTKYSGFSETFAVSKSLAQILKK